MIVCLNVPYQEKESAKLKGARWEPTIKTWYTDDASKILTLSEWIVPHNVICEHLYVFEMERICWKCGKSIRVVCLGTNKSYLAENKYKVNIDTQLFSYITSMPNVLSKHMKRRYGYYPSYSFTDKSVYYVNHCQYCKSIQGDNYLHEIPAESFYKKLCYIHEKQTSYAMIRNQYCLPLQVQLPYYDKVLASRELMMEHLRTGIENRASLNISQALMNKLFTVTTIQQDIIIDGL